MATNHTYSTYSINGKTLHILKTAASNIKLVNYAGSGNLEDHSDFGSNGGFFSTHPLSIAISDGVTICDDNHFLGGGIVGYNGSEIVYMTHVQSADALSSSVRGQGKWAQGGFSMWLGCSSWESKMLEETPMPDHYNVARQRTVLVADTTTKNVWLISTTNGFTFADIRAAVIAYFGSIGYTINETSGGVSRFKGLILDGGGSAQLRAKKSNNTVVFNAANTNRDLYQCIVLRNQN